MFPASRYQPWQEMRRTSRLAPPRTWYSSAKASRLRSPRSVQIAHVSHVLTSPYSPEDGPPCHRRRDCRHVYVSDTSRQEGSQSRRSANKHPSMPVRGRIPRMVPALHEWPSHSIILGGQGQRLQHQCVLASPYLTTVRRRDRHQRVHKPFRPHRRSVSL